MGFQNSTGLLSRVALIPVGVVDVFHGASGAVIHRLAEGDGGIQHLLAGGRRQVRGRGFLHHFLVAALQGTIPFAQGNHIAFAIPEYLDFHMAGPGDEALQEHAAVVEEALALAAHGFKGIPQFALAVAAGQADAATAGGFRQFPGPVLQAEFTHLVRGGADKGNAVGLAGLREVGILGEKTITRNNCFSAGVLGGRQNLGLVQIGFTGAVAGQGNRFIGQGHVQAVAVLMGIDGNTANTHDLEGANGADRDFASVGDQYFGKHRGFSPCERGVR